MKRGKNPVSWFATVGTRNGKHGTVLVKADSLKEAKKKLELAKYNKHIVSDVADLDKVTSSSMWTAVRKDIAKLKHKGGVIFLSGKNPAIPLDVLDPSFVEEEKALEKELKADERVKERENGGGSDAYVMGILALIGIGLFAWYKLSKPTTV